MLLWQLTEINEFKIIKYLKRALDKINTTLKIEKETENMKIKATFEMLINTAI